MIHNSYIQYLKSKGYASKTIESNHTMLLSYITWLDVENLEGEEVRNTDLLLYIKYCQKKGVSQVTIQRYLNSVKLYYEYLKENGQMVVNPAVHLKIRGVKRKQLYYIFSPEELHGIYNSYQAKDLIGKRNKVLLGLLVYQGISITELYHLEVDHVKVRAGELEIPPTKRTNERTLVLEPTQVLDLYDYLQITRGAILAQSQQETNRLIISPKGGKDISNYVHSLIKCLKKEHKQLKNAQQLRASVIVKWLRRENLRKAQYLAGHRYVSSTEGYLQNATEGLAEELTIYHPLNGESMRNNSP